MSIALMVEIWKFAEVEGSELLCLLAMADHANDEGRHIYPSMAGLGRKCRLSDKHTRRVVHGLIEAGYLEITRSGGIYQGKNVTNEYRLIPIWRDDKGGSTPAEGSTSTPAEGSTVLPRKGEESSLKSSVKPTDRTRGRAAGLGLDFLREPEVTAADEDNPFEGRPSPTVPVELDADYLRWAMSDVVIRNAPQHLQRVAWLLMQHAGMAPYQPRKVFWSQLEELWAACGKSEAVLVEGIHFALERKQQKGYSLPRPRSFVTFVQGVAREAANKAAVAEMQERGEFVRIEPWPTLAAHIKRLGYGHPWALAGETFPRYLEIPHGQWVSWDLFEEQMKLQQNGGVRRRGRFVQERPRDVMCWYDEPLDEAVARWLAERRESLAANAAGSGDRNV